MELNQEDFEEMLASAGTSGDIGKYFAKNCEWNFDSIEERDVAIVRAADEQSNWSKLSMRVLCFSSP